MKATKQQQEFINAGCKIIELLDAFTDHENADHEVDPDTGIRYDTALDVVTHIQKALLEIPVYRRRFGIKE